MWCKLCLLLTVFHAAASTNVLRRSKKQLPVTPAPKPIIQGANCRFQEVCKDGTECGCYTNSCSGGVERVGGEPFAWEKDAIKPLQVSPVQPFPGTGPSYLAPTGPSMPLPVAGAPWPSMQPNMPWAGFSPVNPGFAAVLPGGGV